MSELRRIQIGSAFLDPGTLRLQQGEREVRLDPKEIGVLLELAAAAPDVVPREQLLARVWAGTAVVENVLDQVIARLRRALSISVQQLVRTTPEPDSSLLICAVFLTALRSTRFAAAQIGVRLQAL